MTGNLGHERNGDARQGSPYSSDERGPVSDDYGSRTGVGGSGTPGPGGVARAPGSFRRFLRAHVVEILLITLVVTVSAALFASAQTSMYRSQADVAVYPPVSATATQQTVDIATQKEVASSGAVVQTASRALHVPEKTLQDGLSVGVPVGTNLLTFSFSDANPRLASMYAQGLASAYVAYENLQVLTAGSVRPVIITSAPIPTTPVSPNRALDVGVALLLGLALGFGTALVRDAMDDRLRGPSDLEAQLDAPVLAVIPAVGRKGDLDQRILTMDSPDSRFAEAFRNLRTRVVLTADRRHERTVLVTSVDAEERGQTAANLAVALAQSGRSVILVCADLRESRAQAHFGVGDVAGLTDVVNGTARLPNVFRQTEVPGLQLLASGPSVDDPAAVLQAPALGSVLSSLSKSFAFVVIASSPMLGSSDVRALAEIADMVLFVADARRSTRARVAAGEQQLDHVRAKLIGCVLDNAGRPIRLKPAPPERPADEGVRESEQAQPPAVPAPPKSEPTGQPAAIDLLQGPPSPAKDKQPVLPAIHDHQREQQPAARRT